MGRYTSINPDEIAAVIDKHTGRVKANFQGIGAIKDAKSFLRTCQNPGVSGARVDFLSSATVITGEEARKAIKKGRV